MTNDSLELYFRMLEVNVSIQELTFYDFFTE